VISSQQLGERISQERRRHDLTQADVAAKLGLSRPTYIGIEKGERRPGAEELVKIAEALQVSLHDLLKEHRAAGEVSPRFRLGLGRGASDVELRGVVDKLEELGRRYVELESLLGIVRVKAPLESIETYRTTPGDGRRSKLAAEDAARTVRGGLGLGDAPAPDVAPRLESEAGIRLFHLDLPSPVAGVFIWGDEIGACVAVNRRHPPERRLWSLLHETGHFLRDREAGDVLPTSGPERMDASEVFADTFAKEFLLPQTGLARRFEEVVRANGARFTIADIFSLARTYGASFQATCMRLEELDLLPTGTYDRLKQQKFKVRETEAQLGLPGTREEATVLPERYINLALAAYEAEKISEGSLAEYLMTDRVSARGIYLQQRRVLVEDQDVDTDIGLDVLSLAG
jgi:Zn-dependent peptidase ImmA (M78 family)/transcriptional regulator with XRE-family HTH domain